MSVSVANPPAMVTSVTAPTKRRYQKRDKSQIATRAIQNRTKPQVFVQTRETGNKFPFSKKLLMDESYTCRLLLKPGAKYDDDDSKDDVVLDKPRNGTKKIILNPERFSEAVVYTAWALLCHDRSPSLLTFDVTGKYDVGDAYRDAASTQFDGGRLVAAAQLFDLGLCLRSPKVQIAAAKWYENVRNTVWSETMIEFLNSDIEGFDKEREAYYWWALEAEKLDQEMINAVQEMAARNKPEQFAVMAEEEGPTLRVLEWLSESS